MIYTNMKHLTVILVLLCIPGFMQVKAQEKILDTHIHLYDTNREGSFDFLDNHASSGGDFLRFPHLANVFLDSASSSGVEFAYVVEASLRREDNFWLSVITDTSDCLLGFSANLDPGASTYRADLDSLLQNSKFRGIRPRGWGIDLGDISVQRQFVELARRGLALELWGNSPDIASIARMFPNMNIIVNHFGSGNIYNGTVGPADYASRMAILAAEPNVYMKISALYTLSGSQPAPTDMEYYKPLINAALDAFGPDRVMYGSNWSLSGLRGPYAGMVDLLKNYCEQHEDLSPEQLFYNNAMKAYGLAENNNTHSGTGNGLYVSFWNGKAGGRGWFTDSISGSYTPSVDAYWRESPTDGVNADFWNARYTGELEALVSGTHRLYLTIDNYARLWIDKELILDAWNWESGKRCHMVETDLVAGKKAEIQVDYANASGEGYIRLEWEAEGLSREVVPESQLYNEVDTTAQTSFQTDLIAENRISVFPNPVTREIYIQGPGEGFCTVYSLDGKKMESFRISERLIRKNTSNWEPGIYFIQILCGSRDFTRKIIIS